MKSEEYKSLTDKELKEVITFTCLFCGFFVVLLALAIGGWWTALIIAIEFFVMVGCYWFAPEETKEVLRKIGPESPGPR